MSATVYKLFDLPLPEQAQPEQTAAPRPKQGHPLVEDLQRAVQAALDERLNALFHSADDYLFSLSEKAGTELERRAYFDTMRILRLEQARIIRSFAQEISRSFKFSAPVAGETMELDRMALLPTEELEENIALSRMGSKAKTQHKTQLQDIEQRLERLVRGMELPLSSRALSPTRFCEAFRSCLDHLDLEFSTRLVLFKLFDRVVLGGLEAVYAAAAEVLDRHQVGTPRPSLSCIAVDAQTLRALEGICGFSSTALFADAMLANRLLECARGRLQAGSDAVNLRLALLGQMFGEWLADPFLPAAFAPLIENLRFPAIKAALADGSFFTHSGHPVRTQLQDAVYMALAARIGGAHALEFTRERLSRLPDQFAISASFVERALPQMEVMADLEVSEFLESQRAETASRRAELLNKVRLVVSQELEVYMLGRQLHGSAQRLLRAGLGPLMAVRLMREGMRSEGWNNACDKVSRILASLEPRAQIDLTERQALREALAADFAAIGLRDDKVKQLLGNLQEAHADMDQMSVQAAPAAAPASATDSAAPILKTPAPASDNKNAATLRDCLRQLLAQDSWFRVYDAGSKQVRWLKLTRFYPERECARFDGFNSDAMLTLGIQDLVADLKSGRAEPINPTQAMQDALQAIRG